MTGGASIRVVIVDDQTVVREGLVLLVGLLPGIDVVGTGSNGAEALRVVAEQRPDVVLMDLRMPHMDGIEATRRIRADHPGVHVVVLTTYSDEETVLAGLRAGAHGYLTKDARADEIARRLFITEATVKTHINNLFAKAGVRDRAQAVAYAFRHRLATPEADMP